MPEGLGSWMMLAAQAVLAVITVEQLRRRVLLGGRAWSLRHPEIVFDVWGPVIVVLPMLGFVAHATSTVRGPGWMIAGGPVAAAVIALGAAMIVSNSPRSDRSISGINPLARIAFTGAGLALLLLASAHHLTLWMGQCAFAAAALLLWMNTPEHYTHDRNDPDEMNAASGMTIALLAAAVHAVVAYRVPVELADVSAGIIMITAVMVITSAARLGGASASIRLGGWAATYGVLLAWGVLSLQRLVPGAYQVIKTGQAEPLGRIAHGFGAYALEAMLLVMFAPLWLLAGRTGRRLMRVLGVVILLGGAVAIAWRLASF